MSDKTVAFSVEDGFLVKYCRSLALEDGWRKALRILTTVTNPKLSLDDAVGIMAGKYDIEGTEAEGFRIVAQDPRETVFTQYQSTLSWQKAGLLEIDGAFYQPYALIEGFTSDDETSVLTALQAREDWASMQSYRAERARYYMEDPRLDLVFFDIADKPVLMRRVKEPPLWVVTFENPKDAFVDFFEKRADSLQYVGQESNKPSADSLSWEFYFRAVLEGVLYGADDIDMSNEDWLCFQELLALRDAFDEQVAVLSRKNKGDSEPDDQAVFCDEEWHKERFVDKAYALLYRTRIEKQAQLSGGFLQLKVNFPEGEREIRIPRAPFLNWARRMAFGKKHGKLPRWVPVCPTGLKMLGDNPYHTDWWVGAGFLPKEAYDHDHPVNKAGWRYAYALAFSDGEQCLKLAGDGKVTGPVVFAKPNEAVPAGAIAVVSHAGVDYELALMSACKEGAGAVIAEVGGKLAHLSVVSREIGARLVVVDGALGKFKEGEIVTIDLDASRFEIHGRKDPFEDADV